MIFNFSIFTNSIINLKSFLMLPISYSKSSPKILNGGEEIKEEKEIKLNKVKEIQTSNLSTMSPSSSPTKKSSIKDFLILKDLGRGAYGKVTLAKYVVNHKKIAIKILDKKFMNKHNKSHEALIEREILSNCDHPNIIKLISTFHDKDKLYYVLEYAQNKDLANFIRSQGVLSLDLGKFYSAEIVNAVEYLHNKNIAHRDLKPENMVLDHNMHIKLVDFSTAAINGMYFCRNEMKFKSIIKLENGAVEDTAEYTAESSEDLEEDLIGTAEYASPEMLNNTVPNFLTTDIWALGCIIYKFFHGKTPFHASTNVVIFENILKMKLNISRDLPEAVQDIIKRLLTVSPEHRLGAGEKGGEYDFEALKKHEFFEGIDFLSLKCQIPPIKIAFLSKSDSDLTFKSNLSKISEFDINLKNCPSTETSPFNNCLTKHNSTSFCKHENFILSDFSFESFADLQDDQFIEDYLTRVEDYNKTPTNHHSFNEQISLLYEGLVKKQAFFLVYTSRRLKLFSDKKLEIWDCERNTLLSIIMINSKCNVFVSEKDTFDILDGNDTKHRFKTSQSEVKKWVSMLKELISFRKNNLSAE